MAVKSPRPELTVSSHAYIRSLHPRQTGPPEAYRYSQGEGLGAPGQTATLLFGATRIRLNTYPFGPTPFASQVMVDRVVMKESCIITRKY